MIEANLYSNAPLDSASGVTARSQSIARRGASWLAAPRWVVLTSVAVAHVWTMTWLTWALEPNASPHLPATRLGLNAALAWGCLAAAGIVIGAAALGALPVRRGGQQPSSKPGEADETGETGEAGAAARRTGGCLEGCLTRSIVGVGGTAIGLIAAAQLDGLSLLLGVAAAMGVVLYPLAGRFFPAVAVVGAGLWHGLVMALADPLLSFAWPAVLTLTHVVAVGAWSRAYGVERPRLTARGGWGVCLGWAFLTLLLVGGMTGRGGAVAMGGGIWAPPAVAVGGFVTVVAAVVWQVRRREASHRPASHRPVSWPCDAARWADRVGTRWLMVYDAAWLLGAGLLWPAAGPIVLLAAAMLWPRGGRGRRHSGGRGGAVRYQLP